MPTKGVIRVEGLRELDKAFALMGRGMEKGLREALEAASEPVQRDAQALARLAIKPPKSVDWSLMRIGVSRRTSYVAPQQRGRGTRPGRRRPNLKAILLGRAMEPALARNIAAVRREFNVALHDLFRIWGRI